MGSLLIPIQEMPGVASLDVLGGQQDEDIGDLEIRIKTGFPTDLRA